MPLMFPASLEITAPDRQRTHTDTHARTSAHTHPHHTVFLSTRLASFCSQFPPDLVYMLSICGGGCVCTCMYCSL